jgi:3-isopropylmalate/(R)-2-methylmalate dehydratase small subunit
VLVDFSEPMLDAARRAGEGDGAWHVVRGDLTEPQWREQLPGGRYDAVVSGLAIHHLPTARKRALFTEVHELLEPEGLFVNLDYVTQHGPLAGLWDEEMLATAVRHDHAHGGGRDEAEVEADIFDDSEEDQPDTAEEQVAWLRAAAFDPADVYFKWAEAAVFGGVRPIHTISGKVSHLDRANVDTDQIMPKQFLKRVERTGFGEFLFFDWAQEPGWELPANPILVAGENFGCGSSREHAPWGLQDYGFRAIVAPSFADIFYSNCTKIGLLPVVLEEEDCRALARAGEGEVDLEAQEVRFDGREIAFQIDHETRRRLLEGLDDIGVTLAGEQAISAYERERERSGPVTTAL